MISRRTGLSLNMGAHDLGTPVIGPADPRPRCKQCGGPWNGSHLLFCDVCEERHLDFMEDAQHEQDARESDQELVW